MSSAPLEKSQTLLDDGNVAPFVKTRSIPVGRRTSQTHRKDVTRRDLNQFSKDTNTRERPAHAFTTSLLPVRGMERDQPAPKRTDMTALMGLQTNSQRELPSGSHSRPSLQALCTCARTYSSEFCHETNHIQSRPATRLRTDGIRSARSDALHSGWRNAPSRSTKAAAWSVCYVSRPCTVVSSQLQPHVLIHLPHRLPNRGSSPTLIPSSSSPLRSSASVSALEQHMVDLGEMTRPSLSQADVMISAASTLCLITAIRRPTAH